MAIKQLQNRTRKEQIKNLKIPLNDLQTKQKKTAHLTRTPNEIILAALLNALSCESNLQGKLITWKCKQSSYLMKINLRTNQRE